MQLLFGFVIQHRGEGERECDACQDQTMVAKETTVGVAPMQLTFAYNYTETSDNRPHNTCVEVKLRYIGMVFFCSPLNDSFVVIFEGQCSFSFAKMQTSVV